MQIYVSARGRDCWEGSTGYPVRTLEKAALLAREAKKEKEGIIIHLEEGIYYLENPLVFEPEDSGMDGTQILYQGHGDVVISGGTRIYPNWEYIGDGIYRAALEKGLEFDQFFVNDEKKIMARYPNYDETVKYFQGYAADCLSSSHTERYAHPEGGYIHAMHRALWGDMHYRITGRNEGGELEYAGGWQNNRPSEMHGEIRFIENILEELDSPGEWFYDKEGYLYYYPDKGEELEHALYETAGLKNLITIKGTEKDPVKNLSFSGITFRHARRTFMEPMEPVLRSDWCLYRGGAIFLEGTEHVSFVGCRIEGVAETVLWSAGITGTC